MPKVRHIYTVKLRSKDGKPLPFFDMIKMTENYELVAEYQMVEGKGGAISCTCPAHKPWHKHCDILRAFQAEDRINSGYFYDYDKKSWIPPVNMEPTE